MNRVKELRIKAGMQQKELAIMVGVSRPTVSEWEHGKKNPSGERLRKISKIFNVDPGFVLGYSTPIQIRTKIDGSVPLTQSAVPILGNITCGERVTPDTNPEGFADLPEGVHADFALRCKGDSMIPTFLDSDLVLIKQQPEVENGQIAAVNIDNETTLKRIYMQENGIILRADNPAFGQVFIHSDRQIIIHGLAVGYTRLFRKGVT